MTNEKADKVRAFLIIIAAFSVILLAVGVVAIGLTFAYSQMSGDHVRGPDVTQHEYFACKSCTACNGDTESVRYGWSGFTYDNGTESPIVWSCNCYDDEAAEWRESCDVSDSGVVVYDR